MAADDCATDLGGFGKAAAQNRSNDSWPNEIGGEADDVERSQRTSTHCKNVRERVGRCDLAIGKRVVHNRREKINRLYQRAMTVQAIYAGVIEGQRAHEHVAVQPNGKLRQNLSQGLLAQFGSSPRAGRERCEFTNLLARHLVHLLSLILSFRAKSRNPGELLWVQPRGILRLRFAPLRMTREKQAERIGIEPTSSRQTRRQRF